MNSVKTILLVEEEFLIALDIQRMIEGVVAAQVMLARTASEALSMRESWSKVDLAIVELRPGDSDCVELCRALQAGGIAVIASSGEGRTRFSASELAGLHLLARPIAEEALASAVETALANTQNE